MKLIIFQPYRDAHMFFLTANGVHFSFLYLRFLNRYKIQS